MSSVTRPYFMLHNNGGWCKRIVYTSVEKQGREVRLVSGYDSSQMLTIPSLHVLSEDNEELSVKFMKAISHELLEEEVEEVEGDAQDNFLPCVIR